MPTFENILRKPFKGLTQFSENCKPNPQIMLKKPALFVHIFKMRVQNATKLLSVGNTASILLTWNG